MEENYKERDEISLSEIFKILFKRWWILLITLVVGLGAGFLAGFVKNVNKDYYGTTVVFYVNPYKNNTTNEYPVYGSYGDNVTETMVVLLESPMFAKNILVGMENAPQEKINGEYNPEYEKLLLKIQQSITFTNSDSSLTTTVNQPNNVFYAKISVLNDKDFAKLLLVRLEEETKAFIEKNMPLPSGYDGTSCQKLSVVDKIEKTNSGNMKSDMLKYGVLLGAATFIVGCVIVVIVDRVQKKKEGTVSETNE